MPKYIVDLSEHEGPVDYEKMAPAIAGVILRCGFGLQKDTSYEEHYRQFKMLDMPVATYHFPIDQRGAKDQVNFVGDCIGGKELSLNLWCDIEKPPAPNTQSRPLIEAYIGMTESILGIKSGFYSSPGGWFDVMKNLPYLADRAYWAAQYKVAWPDMVPGIKRWTIWQFTDEGKLPGCPSYLDLNHYNTALLANIPPIKFNFDGTKYLGVLITTNTTMNLMVRNEPHGAKILSVLEPASTVKYLEVKDNWYRIEGQGWISGDYVKILEVYSDTPLPPVVIPPVDEPQDCLFEAVVTSVYDWLPIRSGPGMNYTETGRLVNGEKLKVLEADKDRWYRIGPSQWIYGYNVSSAAPTDQKILYPFEKEIRISQQYGAATGAYASSNGHNGIDFACPKGTKLLAGADGFVETMEMFTTYGYGRHLRIRVAGGVLIYGHMSEVYAEKGEPILAGQVIGLSGGGTDSPYSGNSTGPHLHLEKRLDKVIVPEVYGSRRYNSVNLNPLLIWPKK